MTKTGKIMKGIAGFYYVHVAQVGLVECHAKGIFRKEGKKPLVGDVVEIEILDEEKAEYEEIKANYRAFKAENASLKAEVELCDRFKKEAQEENNKLQSLVEALKKGNENACRIAKEVQKV